jgi:hypothetical protein
MGDQAIWICNVPKKSEELKGLILVCVSCLLNIF